MHRVFPVSATDKQMKICSHPFHGSSCHVQDLQVVSGPLVTQSPHKQLPNTPVPVQNLVWHKLNPTIMLAMFCGAAQDSRQIIYLNCLLANWPETA